MSTSSDKYEVSSNTGNGGHARPVLVEHEANWRAFDELPKSIREYLIECPVDYAATMVLDVWKQIWDEEFTNSFFPSHQRAEARMIEMIRQNVAEDTKPYRELLANTPARTLTHQKRTPNLAPLSGGIFPHKYY